MNRFSLKPNVNPAFKVMQPLPFVGGPFMDARGDSGCRLSVTPQAVFAEKARFANLVPLERQFSPASAVRLDY